MGNRRHAREAALGFLYQKDHQVGSVTEDPEKYIEHFKVQEAFQSFFREIITGVMAHQSTLDREIEEVAEHWKLYRMGRVDRSILRLASWELTYCLETPAKVILDEAVELAKTYGSQDSASFVNGILDRISKKARSSVTTDSLAAKAG